MADVEKSGVGTTGAENQDKGQDGGKTFTQDEVNEIVKKRLDRERNKSAAATDGRGGSPKEESNPQEPEAEDLNKKFKEKETELLQRELKIKAKEAFMELGIKGDYEEIATDRLRFDSQESFDESIAYIQDKLVPLFKKHEAPPAFVLPQSGSGIKLNTIEQAFDKKNQHEPRDKYNERWKS